MKKGEPKKVENWICDCEEGYIYPVTKKSCSMCKKERAYNSWIFPEETIEKMYEMWKAGETYETIRDFLGLPKDKRYNYVIVNNITKILNKK